LKYKKLDWLFSGLGTTYFLRFKHLKTSNSEINLQLPDGVTGGAEYLDNS